MFCLDPRLGQITELGDLTEACGEKGTRAIPQGKSHVNFVEANSKLYFATHVGVYSIVEGKETMGVPPPTSPGHMGYNWRQVFWRAQDRRIYGVHGNSGYLFRFDPRAPRLEVLERLTAEPSKRSGMFDQFSYGYLGFGFGPDGKTVHYLTGGPIMARSSMRTASARST